MTTEVLEQNRELEQRIKDPFRWTLGESAITEMTRTVRDNDPNNVYKPTVFNVSTTFYSRKKKFHSRADFFGIT